MILDTVDRLPLYESILPGAAGIAKRFREQNTENAPWEIRQKEYDTKPDEKRRFEVHGHTVDLMLCRSGREVIHLCPASDLTPAESLPNGADGRKLDGGPRGSALLLCPGCFIAIFPGEAHMVGGQAVCGVSETISKWVVKVSV